MDTQQLLSSSSLSTVPAPCPKIATIRRLIIDLMAEGKPVEAIRLYRYAFFRTPLMARPASVKKSILRALWSAYSAYEEASYESSQESQSQLLLDCSDVEWAECEQDGTLYLAIELVMNDGTVQRKRDILFGRHSFVIDSMCCPRGMLSEDLLVYVENELA